MSVIYQRRAEHVQREERAGARIGPESANEIAGRSRGLVVLDRVSRRPQRGENGRRRWFGKDSLQNGREEG